MPDSFIFHSFLYIKSNQLLSWKSSTQCSELHFGRMLLHTGKLLNPHPVPMLLQQLVNLNLKILLPWSTSSDTYCKPLLSNKRFQNNQILSWKKSTRSSNLHFGNMWLHTGQLFSPHPIQPLSAKQQFQLLCCLLNKGLQQGAAQQAICLFASSTGALLQVSNDNLNGEL